MLYENTIPEDVVTVKMDIEGSEWDVLPCLSRSMEVPLIDNLFVEIHPSPWGLTGTTQDQIDQALALMKSKGVNVPPYHSLG